LTDLINRKITKTSKPDEHTIIQTEATTDSIDNIKFKLNDLK
jgi:hypothetical protein